jgi:chromate transporter
LRKRGKGERLNDHGGSPPPVPLRTIFLAFLRIGLTAYGLAILQKLRALVIQHGWLTEAEASEGLAMVQLYPGPIMVDFTSYVGYRLRGVPGALAATLGFVLPAFVLVVALSAAYFSGGELPWVHKLFLGLEALLIGVIANVTLNLGQQAIKGRVEVFIALAAFIALLFKVNAILVPLAALGVGAFAIAPRQATAPTTHPPAAPPRRLMAVTALALAVIASAVAAALSGTAIGQLAASLFKIGAVAFGSGMAIISVMQAEVVQAHGWVSQREFLDGLALGQITPGPILLTAAFIGYKLGGVLGAALATFAIFSPSIAMTLVFTEVFGRIKHLQRVHGALAGVLAAFVGLLAATLVQLGGSVLADPVMVAFATAAFVATRWFALDIAWVFGGGLALWALLLAAGDDSATTEADAPE